jgi:signal transduction histidine kinase
MEDISLHLLDIIENSARAESSLVQISIEINKKENSLKIRVEDDGHGMDEDMLINSQNPFFTTKTDRVKKVGLGIPLFKQNAELCDGSFEMTSELNKGTVITAEFRLDHIDRMPLGDIGDTIVAAIFGHQETDFRLTLKAVDENDERREFSFDTEEIKQELGDVPLSHPEVTSFIRSYLNEGITNIL